MAWESHNLHYHPGQSHFFLALFATRRRAPHPKLPPPAHLLLYPRRARLQELPLSATIRPAGQPRKQAGRQARKKGRSQQSCRQVPPNTHCCHRQVTLEECPPRDDPVPNRKCSCSSLVQLRDVTTNGGHPGTTAHPGLGTCGVSIRRSASSDR